MPIVDPSDPNYGLLSQYDLGFEPNNATFTGAQIVHPTMEIIHQGRVDGFDVYSAVVTLRINNQGTAASGLLVYGDHTTGKLIRIDNQTFADRYELIMDGLGRMGLSTLKVNAVGARLEIDQADTAVVGQILFAKGSTGSDLLQAINSSGVKILWVDILGQLHWVDSQSNEFVFVDPNPHPVINGLLGWGFPPNFASGTAHMTEGTVYLQKFYLNKPSTLSSLMFNVTNAANAPTSAYGGLYSTGGTQLAVSANSTASFTSTGDKTLSFTSPYVANTGYYYTALLVAAGPGNGPDLSASTASSAVANINLTGATLRYCTGPTGQTTLPASITMSSNVSAVGLWTGVK